MCANDGPVMSSSTNAGVGVPTPATALARASATWSISRTARITRVRVVELTGHTPPSTRDTVDADTPARAATSRIVLRPAASLLLGMPSPPHRREPRQHHRNRFPRGRPAPGRRRGRCHVQAVPRARLIDAIASGPTRQHPPTSFAPASRHVFTRSAPKLVRPVQARASASQASPLFG